MKLTFIELPLFTSLVMQVTDDHFLNQLQNDLLKDPEKGDIISRLQGLRKVRMALQGPGQAAHGSFTFIFPNTTRSFSFTFIPKPSRRTSPPDQEKRLRAAVEIIKREFRHENQ